MSGLFSNIYTIFVILVNVYIVFRVYEYFIEKKEEGNLPVREEIATIVSKRKKITPYGAKRLVHGVRKSYYATFQFQDGQRVELTVYEYQYEQLIIGDIGHLHFQGKKCLTFNV